MIFSHKCKLLGWVIQVFDDIGELKKFWAEVCKEEGIEDHSGDVDAEAFCISAGFKCAIFIKQPKRLDLIVHEIVHAVTQYMDYSEIKDDEFRAYVTGELVDMYYKDVCGTQITTNVDVVLKPVEGESVLGEVGGGFVPDEVSVDIPVNLKDSKNKITFGPDPLDHLGYKRNFDDKVEYDLRRKVEVLAESQYLQSIIVKASAKDIDTEICFFPISVDQNDDQTLIIFYSKDQGLIALTLGPATTKEWFDFVKRRIELKIKVTVRFSKADECWYLV